MNRCVPVGSVRLIEVESTDITKFIMSNKRLLRLNNYQTLNNTLLIIICSLNPIQ